MNPAFSPSNLRALTPIFFAKAAEVSCFYCLPACQSLTPAVSSPQLRDKWISIIPDPVKGEKLNVCHWLSRATFDVIGLAGLISTWRLAVKVLKLKHSIRVRLYVQCYPE
jgi:hypothetical protein